MGESITTRLDAPYGQQPKTRAAAIRVLTRTGNADLIEILGLTEPEPPAPAPPKGTHCPKGHRLPSHGICRRSEDCRIAARQAGYEA
jgi:hypothetical protein